MHRAILKLNVHYVWRCSASTITSQAAAMRDLIDVELTAIKEAGTWKGERIINTKQAAIIGVANRKEKVLNFCANNYLGLSVQNTICLSSLKYFTYFMYFINLKCKYFNCSVLIKVIEFLGF